MVGVMVLLIYEGYNSELRLESQEDFVDTWEREWVVFQMIFDDYEKFLDAKLRIYKESESDDDEVNKE